jgi:hypothetical protein
VAQLGGEGIGGSGDETSGDWSQKLDFTAKDAEEFGNPKTHHY